MDIRGMKTVEAGLLALLFIVILGILIYGVVFFREKSFDYQKACSEAVDLWGYDYSKIRVEEYLERCVITDTNGDEIRLKISKSR